MKKIFCSQYDDVECCETCHHEDSFFVSYYKSLSISHCCLSLTDIKSDIDKYDKLENNCD